MKSAAMAIAIVLMPLGATWAQGRPAAQRGVVAAVAAARETAATVTRFDFDNDILIGEIVRPDGGLVDALRSVHRESLLRPRLSFVPELVKSVEGR